MPLAMRRPAAVVAAATLVLLALAPAALPRDHRAIAADRGLVMVAQTSYQALPELARVHVTIDAVVTSYTPNSASSVFYYTATSIAAQPGATSFNATSGGTQLRVAVIETAADFVAVKVTFGREVYYGQSFPLRLTFDLPDPGGAPDRDVRIGRSIVAFPVWAFGSEGEPGGSVQVILPAGFTANVQGDPLTVSRTADGGTLLSATSIADPYTFAAYLSADRPGGFTETRFNVGVGSQSAPISVRAWEDDPEWGARLKDLMTRGLPALQSLIGLPYPVVGTLKVEEAATSRLGEYAGIYNASTEMIRVRYDADAYVALHEAAHVWFNTNLLADRWIGEAWAEFYGVQAGAQIGAKGSTFGLTDALLANKIPLNDWGSLGTVNLGTEDYAYAVTYHLSLLVVQRTDLAGLRRVWSAVGNAEMSYQPTHADGPARKGVPALVPGWERLLDLLDERTSASYDDLWLEWVVDAAQKPLMAERTTAREDYVKVAAAAAPWDLPQQIRVDMGAWTFDSAEKEIATATDVLAERGRIIAEADVLGLSPPATLRQTFEGSDAGALDAAVREAKDELAALNHVGVASRALGTKPDLIESIGLLGADPSADVAAAGAAFEAGDLPHAEQAADRAASARAGAASAGQLRVAGAGGGLVVLAGGSFLVIRVRRRRAAAPSVVAPAAESPTDDSPDPSA
jgi:hypothetical protein